MHIDAGTHRAKQESFSVKLRAKEIDRRAVSRHIDTALKRPK